MSVPVTDPIDQYVVANAAETTFTYTWLINSAAEIVVQKQDNSVDPPTTETLTLTTDYTVQDVGETGGGTITIAAPQSPVVVGDVWTLSRASTINRPQDFATSGDFQAVTINQQLDNLTRIAQDQQRDIDAGVKKDSAVGDALDPLIPQPVDRRALLFSGDGSDPENFTLIMSDNDPDEQSDAAAVSAAAALVSEQAAAQSATDAEDAAQSIEIGQPFYGEVNPQSVNYQILAADNGKLISVDTTSGDIDITLIDSSTLTTDFRIGIEKSSSDSNNVNVKRAGSDTINGSISDIVQSTQFKINNYVLDQSGADWVAGTSQIATQTEVDAGTEGNTLITPLTLATKAIGFQSMQTFIVGGTWNQPTGIRKILIICTGGGGGAATGSGGAAATVLKFVSPPASSYTITIGAGGAAQALGGTSSVGTVASANGGGGGSGGNPGVGATVGVGDLVVAGGDGFGITNGQGGGSFWGGGGGGTQIQNANVFGAGGGGTNGTGKSGVIVILEFA